MKTFMLKTAEVEKKWILIDATDKVLGRLATRVATILRGKHKPDFTPHIDCGDNVIIINADKIKLTGNKFKEKLYYAHSGYFGGLKTTTYEKLIDKHPIDPIRKAILRMIKYTPIRKQIARHLYVYVGSEHCHEGQQPVIMEI